MMMKEQISGLSVAALKNGRHKLTELQLTSRHQTLSIQNHHICPHVEHLVKILEDLVRSGKILPKPWHGNFLALSSKILSRTLVNGSCMDLVWILPRNSTQVLPLCLAWFFVILIPVRMCLPFISMQSDISPLNASFLGGRGSGSFRQAILLCLHMHALTSNSLSPFSASRRPGWL